MDDPTVDPDRKARIRGHRDGGFLDPEADMPAKWVLYQPCARDPSRAVPRDAWQWPSPAEADLADERDLHTPPPRVQALDLEFGGVHHLTLADLIGAALATGLTVTRLEEPGDDDYPLLIALQLAK